MECAPRVIKPPRLSHHGIYTHHEEQWNQTRNIFISSPQQNICFGRTDCKQISSNDLISTSKLTWNQFGALHECLQRLWKSLNRNEQTEDAIYGYCRLQVRYGRQWAPMHPEGMIPGNLTEILLEDGEIFKEVEVFYGWVIDFIAFESNMRRYAPVGFRSGLTHNAHVSLKNAVFFSGNGYHDHSNDILWVTQLLAHRATCV